MALTAKELKLLSTLIAEQHIRDGMGIWWLYSGEPTPEAEGSRTRGDWQDLEEYQQTFEQEVISVKRIRELLYGLPSALKKSEDIAVYTFYDDEAGISTLGIMQRTL